MNRCKNCAYFLDYKVETTFPGVSQGECHRYPPVYVSDCAETKDGDADSGGWVFPGVFDTSVCGEYKNDQTHDVVRSGTSIERAKVSGLLRNALREGGFETMEEAQINLRSSVQFRCNRLGAKALQELESWAP